MPNAGDIIRASDFDANDRFVLEKSSDQTISNVSATDVIWQTEVEDPNGLVTASGSFDTFTVPSGKAGIWSHTANVQWSDPATACARIVFIVVNNTIVSTGQASGETGTNNHLSNGGCSWTGYLDESDTVAIRVFQNSGGNLNVEAISTGTRTTRWTAQRIIAG